MAIGLSHVYKMRQQWDPYLFDHEYDYIQTELDNTKFCYQLIITITKFAMF